MWDGCIFFPPRTKANGKPIRPKQKPKHPKGETGMNITDIRIRKIYEDARLKALVSVTIDGDLAVHDIKVIEGPERLFVAMPSRKDENGTFRDIAHPITPEARHTLEEAILDRYQTHLAQAEAEQAATPHIPA